MILLFKIFYQCGSFLKKEQEIITKRRIDDNYYHRRIDFFTEKTDYPMFYIPAGNFSMCVVTYLSECHRRPMKSWSKIEFVHQLILQLCSVFKLAVVYLNSQSVVPVLFWSTNFKTNSVSLPASRNMFFTALPIINLPLGVHHYGIHSCMKLLH